MATIERFEDIEAWQAARTLRRAVYPLTRSKPFSSDFTLVDQIRRAAVSPGSNIAEGFERGGNRGFMTYLRKAEPTGHKFDTSARVNPKLKTQNSKPA